MSQQWVWYDKHNGQIGGILVKKYIVKITTQIINTIFHIICLIINFMKYLKKSNNWFILYSSSSLDELIFFIVFIIKTLNTIIVIIPIMSWACGVTSIIE